MIIDAHAHIFPNKIAEKASAGISAFYDGMAMDSSGTVGELLQKGEKAGVDRFIVQSVATIPEQVASINNFIARTVAKYPDKLIGFGTLHPNFGDISGEVERIISLGLRGIKLHSDFQEFDIDDERAFPIYEAAEGRLPILFHCGDKRTDRSSPERLINIVRRFPGLIVIGAHFAGWSMWDRGAEIFADYLRNNEKARVYTDCSSSLYAMPPEHAADIIGKFGAKRVLWGTDYPMWNAEEDLARFMKLPLSLRERELILGENALRMLSDNSPTEVSK